MTPMMLLTGIVMSFAMGFTVLIARSVGAQDYDRAHSLTRQGLVFVMMLGVPLFLIQFSLARAIPKMMGAEPDVLVLATSYNKIMACAMLFRVLTMLLSSIYRGFGDTKTPMFINTGVNLANVVGNYLLIYSPHDVSLFGKTFHVWGAGLGVFGAGLSSCLTIAVGSMILLALTFFKPSDIQISIHDSYKINNDDMQQVMKVSVPVVLERLTMSGASVVIASTVSSLGTIAIASNSLAATVESFCFMPGFAFQQASTTLVGQSLGAKKPDMAEKYVSRAIRISIPLIGTLSIIMALNAKALINLFTPDAQVIQTGSELIKLLAVIEVPYIISMIHSGALRGAGDTKGPFYITLASMWGVRVLGATILIRVMGLGIHFVIVAMNTDNIVRMILFWLRYRKGNWKTQRI